MRFAIVAVALAAALAAAGTGGGAASSGGGGVAPLAVVGPHLAGVAGQPPTSAQCQAAFGIACYGPPDLRAQYQFGPAYAAADTGKGQTIVIFDSFGSPTIAQDLATFDAAYNIPAPPSFTVYEPEGNVVYDYLNVSAAAVAANKNQQTEINWGYETTLDVEWSHAMAPGASIALVVTPNAETEGVQGLTNLQNAQRWALDHHIGTIWSNSWAATEQSFHDTPVVEGLNALYHQAASEGVSAFFATGDSGAANVDKQGAIYPTPTVNFPNSSPDVVAVGGTEIAGGGTQPISSYQPEAAWNDFAGAGGGGFSSIFAEPSYQGSIADAAGTRAVPDVSYNAALISSILVYESFDPRAPAGWTLIGGTSAAAPQWAAVDAIANQADGSLGFLTPRLYQVSASAAAYASSFHDIKTGNNTFNGVTGYPAGAGWDPATGLGTPNVAGLVTALKSTSGGNGALADHAPAAGALVRRPPPARPRRPTRRRRGLSARDGGRATARA